MAIREVGPRRDSRVTGAWPSCCTWCNLATVTTSCQSVLSVFTVGTVTVMQCLSFLLLSILLKENYNQLSLQTLTWRLERCSSAAVVSLCELHCDK